MLYPFSALLARMKYITRWSLMHSTRAESLSEHTCDTALLAHMLCLIARRYTGTPCRPKTVAVAALYHDAPEIITGDMPTPVKYSSPTLRDAYKALETESVRCMTGLLPDELSEELSPFISGELLTAEEKRLLKAALIEAAGDPDVKAPTIKEIDEWLLAQRLIGMERLPTKGFYYVPTPAGVDAGLRSEDKVSARGTPYSVLLFTPEAQRMVVEHFVKAD